MNTYMPKLTILFIVSILTYSCSSTFNNSSPKRLNLTMPDYIKVMPSAKSEEQKNNGSLFNTSNKSLFGDRKAKNVNDLITITISESTRSSTKSSKNIKDSSDFSLGGGILQSGGATNSAISNLAKALNNISNVNLKSSSKNTFKGGGSASRNDSFITTITARIVKRMKNNTMYIQGTRELLINGEHQYISIAGIIRTDDITPSNTIDSKYILDAKIYYDTKGNIATSNKIPWGASLLKSIWPF